MTNKERQAKLQYLLNSLSMTKEQKDIVVDLVNNSGGGAPAKDVIAIKLNEEGNNIVFFRNDIEIASFNSEHIYDEQSKTSTYKSNEMFYFFSSIFDNDFIIVFDVSGVEIESKVLLKAAASTNIVFVFLNSQGLTVSVSIQKEQ